MSGFFDDNTAPAADHEAPSGPGLFGDDLPSAPAAESASGGYRVLARKYRPTTFAEMIGQEALVQTLTNAIQSGRIAHAWMLTGVRGVGKTTTARIIARALNCVGPDGRGGPTVEPCGVCEPCRSIMADRAVDVLEVDAASRTGVDDMREIIDGVRYAPVMCRTKIYIIDEVHMLSKNAFNALLKTLEEPPPHVKFIFATTEIRKVPVTVLSRCQRFDLRRVERDVLAKHFTYVSKAEGVEIEPDAVSLIARAADGSVRDGLSLLDQAIARTAPDTITTASVEAMLGLADRGKVFELYKALLSSAPGHLLKAFGEAVAGGADPLHLLQDMAEITHLLTRAKVLGVAGADIPEYEREFIAAHVDRVAVPGLARIWQILLKGVGEVLSAPNPALAAEMVLVRLAYAADLPDPGELVKKIFNAPDGTPAHGGHGGGGPSGGGSRAARPQLIVTAGGAARRIEETPAPQQAAVASSQPQAVGAILEFPDYRSLVAEFRRREPMLGAQLFSDVALVRLAPGILELSPGPRLPSNFAGQIGKFLTEWTGQRWLVTLAPVPGAKSLADEETAAKAELRARADAHPLMQAALAAFPDAEILDIREPRVEEIVEEKEAEEVAVAADEITDEEELFS